MSSSGADGHGASGVRFHPDHLAEGGSVAPLHVERLYELLGVERSQDDVARALRSYVQGERAPIVGAMHVTCADETEFECAEAFQRNFARYLLPDIKFARRSAMRLSNLGGRYEWGAVGVAEAHYALGGDADDWKILLIKINAHVGRVERQGGRLYGTLERYRGDSPTCGALSALLADDALPFVQDLEALMRFEEIDRLAVLRDARRVPVERRALDAALVSARLQARRCMIDVQEHRPATPTLYLVLPCVSLNHAGHDTEIVCGVYTADRRGDEPHDEYCGLGDRPEHYRVSFGDQGAVRVEDPELRRPRRARDHRAVVAATWRERAHPTPAPPRVREAVEQARGGGAYAKLALESLLAVLLEASPIPAAVLLFGAGAVRAHHAVQAHRLASAADRDDVARAMLEEVRARAQELTPEQAQHLVDLLVREYAP